MIKSRVISTVLAFFLCPAFAGDISIYEDFAAFASQFDSVEAFPQDPSDPGTDLGEGIYEVMVDGVAIQFGGPPFYFDIGGFDVLSKGVPVTITPAEPNAVQGLGFHIFQFSLVDITVIDEDGDVVSLFNYSNEFGETGMSTFLGFVSTAGISTIQITDPTPGDTTTPITNIGPLVTAMGAAPPPESPREVLEALMQEIYDLVPADLNYGQAEGLNHKLSAANNSLETGREEVACRQLNAFLNQVSGLVGAGQLDPTIGQALADEVVTVQGELGCN